MSIAAGHRPTASIRVRSDPRALRYSSHWPGPERQTPPRDRPAHPEAKAIAAARASRPLTSRLAALVLKIFMSIFRQKPARVDQLLSGGQTLSVAGGLQVVDTPGHTPGHISLYVPASAVLFCGDSMEAGRDGRLRLAPSARTWDAEHAKESVRIQQALGAEIVCAGHGPVVRSAADKFPTG